MKPRNYECRKCGKINQITTLFGMFITPHLGWRKWIKCEHCGAKRHFQRRIFQPEIKIREELKETYQVIEALEATNGVITKDARKLESQIEDDKEYITSLEITRDKLERKLEELDIETAKKIFRDIEEKLDYYQYFTEKSYAPELKDGVDELKKKYGVKD